MSEVLFTKIFASDEFKRIARNLEKRYRNVREDIQCLIEQLQSGELSGD